MSWRILIMGGSGLLGVNWAVAARDNHEIVLGLHKREVSLGGVKSVHIDFSSINSLVRDLDVIKPDVVINALGITDVDLCERAPDLAKYVNVELAKNLASSCALLSLPLVHISTDHLFNGDSRLCDENVPVNPVNVYGITKATAENEILNILPQAVVIRCNFYGWGTSYRRSFSDTVIDCLRKNRPINLFNDVHYTPILVESLVQAVHDLLIKKASGIFNVVGGDRITKYQFGLLLAKVFGLDFTLIRLGCLSDFPNLVKRPNDMSLSNRKVREYLGRDLGSVYDHVQRLLQQEQLGLAAELEKL